MKMTAVNCGEPTTRTLFRGSMDFDLVPDFETHQVFAHFERSGISFSGVRHQVRSVERHDMRIDRELWFHLAEDLSGLLWSRVVVDYFLLLLRAEELIAGEVGFRIEHFVNQ